MASASRSSNDKHKHTAIDGLNTRLYTRCGACGSPCGSGEKYCVLCGNDVSRSRAKAAAQIGQACKTSQLSKSDVECIYFHFVFRHYRRPETSRPPTSSEVEEWARVANSTFDTATAAGKAKEWTPTSITVDEIDALRATRTNLLFQDYCQAMAHLVGEALPVEIVRYLFQVYDANLEGRLTRAELYQLLEDNIDPQKLLLDVSSPFLIAGDKSAEVSRDAEIRRGRTRLYTWLKRNFPKFASARKNEDEAHICLSRTLQLLTKIAFVDGNVLMDKISVNFQAVASVIDARNLEEYRDEAVKIYGTKAVAASSAFTRTLVDKQ